MLSGSSFRRAVRPAKDWHLERWRLENRRQAVEKALGRALTVQALEP